jgi:hypothetical protein
MLRLLSAVLTWGRNLVGQSGHFAEPEGSVSSRRAGKHGDETLGAGRLTSA